MRRFFFLIVFFFATVVGSGQPFDLIVPDLTINDSLSTELRHLQAIERDISLEQFKKNKNKVDALAEIGNLRLIQGKLEEAERFFQMAIKIEPEHFLANRGLAMVYYNLGQFGKSKRLFDRMVELYPLSDALKRDVEKVRADLSQTAEFGVMIHEDNRGFFERMSLMEAYFPSFTYPKLSAHYKIEDWSFDDSTLQANSRTLSAIFDYNLDHRSRVSVAYSPEKVGNDEEIGGYTFHGVTGTSNLHLVSYLGRNAFKENPTTVRQALFEDYFTLTLIGDLHERVRISQTLTSSTISDDNSRQLFDTKVLYFITRRGIPQLTLNLNLSQTRYERQLSKTNAGLPYWSPADFKRANLTFSWERGIGANWWWGLETHLITSSYRDLTPETHRENGLGFLIHGSYKFEKGRIHVQFGDTLKENYRERMLGIFGSIDF